MKIVIMLVLALFLVPAADAGADICVKQRAHTDDYYYGGRMTPAENTDIEVWFGDKRMAYVTDNRSIVIDLDGGKLTWINHTDSTYAEATLPFEWAGIADEETVGWLGRYPLLGTIKATERTEKINGFDCRCYEITSWIDVQGSRYNETDERLWVTTDLPVDPETLEKTNAIFAKLRNAGSEYAEALSAVEGYPILSDGDRYIKGFSIKTTEEVVEVLETDPREDVYSVPEGFIRKEKLTIQDIRG
ncbi:MAG: DUF4412 domain-containing protein [bacterium]